VGYNLDLIARCGYVGPLFLFEQYRGRGHARAILKALSEILFVEREVEYIGATVFECARASKVAFEAVGFRHVGFQPVAIRYRGKPYGAHFFGMTRPS
jgi:RimJ/RimL family protein N-acetyltransferase